MSIVTASFEQKKAALQAAVMATLAYWASMEAVDKLYVEDGTVEDKQSDALHDLVTSLAEDWSGSIQAPSPATIEDEHIAALDKIYA